MRRRAQRQLQGYREWQVVFRRLCSIQRPLQDFNIKVGTAFFAQTLSDNGGSLLKTFGNYNGWQPGLTVVSTLRASMRCIRSLAM